MTQVGSTQPLAGLGTLLGAALRRDRVRVVGWAVGLPVLAGYTVLALGRLYPTAADRQGRAALMGNPAAVLLSGPGYGTTNYTPGAMVANELTLTLAVLAALASVQLVVRHTRAAEESGLAELVGAAAVGRRAPLAAALALAGLLQAAVVVLITAALVASGLAWADSLALGLGTGLTGAVFAGVAALAYQVSGRARAASGTAWSLLGAAVLVRGIGDALATQRGAHSSVLSWLSPIGWVQQTRAFVDLRWAPLLLPVGLSALLVVAAFWSAADRDLGAGLLPARRGPAHASSWLAGPVSLAARLQRGSVLGWSVVLVLLGAVFGSLANSVADMVTGNAELARVVAVAGADLSDSFAAVTAAYLSLTVAGFAVAAVLTVRAEEQAGRAELVGSTAVARSRLLGATLITTGAAALGLLLLGGLSAGVAAALSSGDGGQLPRQLGAILAQAPAVLVLAGVAAALVGLAPRVTGLAWLVFGWVLLLGLFGPLLGLPDPVLRSSPLGWLAAVPAEPFAVVPVVVELAVAALLGGAGLLGRARRDLTP